MSINIICVDDHQLFLQGLQKILQSNQQFNVIEVYNHPDKFLRSLRDKDVDVITLDVEMPYIGGLDLCVKIKEFNQNLKVLFITMYETKSIAMQMKRVGADGFVSKNIEAKELFDVIERIHSGEPFFPVAHSQIKVSGTVPPSLLLLTKREKEIIQFIKEGKQTKEISSILFLSEHTVETHRKNIFKKLNIHSTQELLTFVYGFE